MPGRGPWEMLATESGSANCSICSGQHVVCTVGGWLACLHVEASGPRVARISMVVLKNGAHETFLVASMKLEFAGIRLEGRRAPAGKRPPWSRRA